MSLTQRPVSKHVKANNPPLGDTGLIENINLKEAKERLVQATAKVENLQGTVANREEYVNNANDQREKEDDEEEDEVPIDWNRFGNRLKGKTSPRLHRQDEDMRPIYESQGDRLQDIGEVIVPLAKVHHEDREVDMMDIGCNPFLNVETLQR